MFNKKHENVKPSYEKCDTLIGLSTLVEGTIKAEETLRIDGRVQGEVISKGDILVGDKGHVAGNVTCHNLMLAGTVQGNISVSGQLHITASGKLLGDASVHSLIIDEHGIFDGTCQMLKEPAEQLGGSDADSDSAGKENRSLRRNRS